MSKYNPCSPCPFCGHAVIHAYHAKTMVRAYYMRQTDDAEAVCFECTKCGAITAFLDGDMRWENDARHAFKRYNTRTGMPAMISALIGAAVTLIAALLLIAFVVTYRVNDVSRETIASQTTIEHIAAEVDDGRLAGDDIEAAGYAARLYTDADAQALAQMAWGECRGVKALSAGGRIISAKYQKAAAMWCALNRFDAAFDGERIADVVAAPSQFHGYDPEHPIDDDLLALAYDVLERWQAEKTGAADAGRVLPAEYLFFTGDGKNNYFSTEYGSGVYYTWELPDVYAEG